MKKNLIPLLAVAFVVAIISTGIFYGLIAGKLKGTAKPVATAVVAARSLEPGSVIKAEDLTSVPLEEPSEADTLHSPALAVGREVVRPVAAGSPVVESALAPRSAAGGEGVVPEGMRAVSIHVLESAGVIDMLETGDRVDVQFLENQGVPPERRALRTVLENVAVLDVDKPNREGGRNIRPVITLLATPRAADVLTLADDTGTIRLTLRNPKDENPGKPITLRQASLLSGSALTQRNMARAASNTAKQSMAAAKQSHSATVTASSSVTKHPASDTGEVRDSVGVQVRFFEVSDAGWRTLLASDGVPGDDLQVSTLPNEESFSGLMHRLKDSPAARLVSDSRLEVKPGRDAIALAGEDGRISRTTSSRISFRFRTAARGQMRVMPEVRHYGDAGLRVNRLEKEVSLEGGQNYLVTGFEPDVTSSAPTSEHKKVLALISVAPEAGTQRAAIKP